VLLTASFARCGQISAQSQESTNNPPVLPKAEQFADQANDPALRAEVDVYAPALRNHIDVTAFHFPVGFPWIWTVTTILAGTPR